MFRSLIVLCMLAVAVMLSACATDLGTGKKAVAELEQTYPITVGRLVKAEMDTSRRLRIYLEICEEGVDGELACHENTMRVLAMVEAEKKSILERLANRYLPEGTDRPIYVYGPMCDGLKEMVIVPHCQTAIAVGVWDPALREYVIYSPMHGSGSFVESEGFNTFLKVTGKAVGTAKKAVR